MKAVLDRFEGRCAVLLVGEREIKFDLPRELLPDGAKEGNILSITIEIDKEATEMQRSKMEALLKKLQAKQE